MREGKKISDQLDFKLFPQVNINLIVKDKIRVMNNEGLAEFIDACRDEMKSRGRVLVRASGTEPKIRVMAECEDLALAEKIANSIAERVKTI
jgi:phosphoglucosamine mutase